MVLPPSRSPTRRYGSASPILRRSRLRRGRGTRITERPPHRTVRAAFPVFRIRQIIEENYDPTTTSETVARNIANAIANAYAEHSRKQSLTGIFRARESQRGDDRGLAGRAAVGFVQCGAIGHIAFHQFVHHTRRFEFRRRYDQGADRRSPLEGAGR